MADQNISSGGLIAVDVVLTALAMLAVGVRLRIRLSKGVGLGIDDILSVISLILFIVLVFIPTIIGAVDAGLGNHVPITPMGPMPPSYVFEAVQFVFIAFQVFPLCFIKLSILFLYRRIFQGKIFDAVTKILIGFVIVWTITFFLAFLLQCVPVTIAEIPGTNNHCINLTPVTEAFGVSGTITDFMILLIPMPNVWKLRMTVRDKLAVSFIFGLGFIVVIASIIRCTVLFSLGAKISAGDFDYTHYDGVNLIWEITEACVGIICACLPVMGRYMQVLGVVFRMDTLRSLIRRYRTSGPSRESSGRNGPFGEVEEELGAAGVRLERLESTEDEDVTRRALTTTMKDENEKSLKPK
ncbi:hypothetical protein G7Y89_g9560 [Cudoniella acicularis]|uniref:Rhodopsin domain-containing protein n=1 Tax=Cudoniella acicularis TaxID=354080 RepID=A0A8H4W1S1_9HELO|nr:hypothetical protein G7Y89_g9560 [Cudoniella acicularis]